MLKDFISKQTAFNKSVEEKFGKIDALVSKVDSLALDVEILKLKVFPHDVKENKTLNAIHVRIDDNVRMLAELHARWERKDEMARNMKVCTITTTSDVVSNASKPPSFNGRVMTHKYRGSQQSSREVKPKFIDSTQGEPSLNR
jgi:hypothetical protein